MLNLYHKEEELQPKDPNYFKEDYFQQDKRCLADLLYVYHSNCYINEKGYLTKLIDKLYELGYYENNETLFLKKGI